MIAGLQVELWQWRAAKTGAEADGGCFADFAAYAAIHTLMGKACRRRNEDGFGRNPGPDETREQGASGFIHGMSPKGQSQGVFTSTRRLRSP